jgi:hypothetical protein
MSDTPYNRSDNESQVETPPLLIRTGCEIAEILPRYCAISNSEGLVIWCAMAKTNYTRGEKIHVETVVLNRRDQGILLYGNQHIRSDIREVRYLVTDRENGRIIKNTTAIEEGTIATLEGMAGGRYLFREEPVGSIRGHEIKPFATDLRRDYPLTNAGAYLIQARIYTTMPSKTGVHAVDTPAIPITIE